MERQAYKNKIFYHNYGHGGGGVSLSYGCARHTVNLFTANTTDPQLKEVAVIGSGYMGLLEAILLADLAAKLPFTLMLFQSLILGCMIQKLVSLRKWLVDYGCHLDWISKISHYILFWQKKLMITTRNV